MCIFVMFEVKHQSSLKNSIIKFQITNFLQSDSNLETLLHVGFLKWEHGCWKSILIHVDLDFCARMAETLEFPDRFGSTFYLSALVNNTNVEDFYGGEGALSTIETWTFFDKILLKNKNHFYTRATSFKHNWTQISH